MGTRYAVPLLCDTGDPCALLGLVLGLWLRQGTGKRETPRAALQHIGMHGMGAFMVMEQHSAYVQASALMAQWFCEGLNV